VSPSKLNGVWHFTQNSAVGALGEWHCGHSIRLAAMPVGSDALTAKSRETAQKQSPGEPYYTTAGGCAYSKEPGSYGCRQSHYRDSQLLTAEFAEAYRTVSSKAIEVRGVT
jgi:hypothetical protein